MKIVVLAEDRVKVELDHQELLELDINISELTPESPEVNRLLDKIMKDVTRQTGLIIENGQILIVASKDRGAEITLLSDTKLKRRSKSAGRGERLIFEIPSQEDVFMMLSVLKEKILRKMILYRLGKVFYISLPRFPVPVEMWEFSKKCKRNRLSESVLAEHGTLIAGGEQVISMAKEIKKDDLGIEKI